MPEPRIRLLRSLPEVERRGSTRPQRPIRAACRYRVPTDVVPEGRRVRHPRCPLCGERLAYRADADQALYLHVDDPRFRVTVLP